MAEQSRARVYGRSLAGIASSNPVDGGMDMYLLLLCVFPGRGLCVGPIFRSGQSYRLCVRVCVCMCVIACDLETSEIRRSWPALGCCSKEEDVICYALH